MTQPLVTIVTPTYQRPQMFAECAQSVLAQSFKDWVWWVVVNDTEWPEGYWLGTHHWIWEDPRVVPIWFPVGDAMRKASHIPARIVNWLYPKVQTDYIYFLADDDLIDPDGLGVLVEAAQDKWRAMRSDELGPFGGSGVTQTKERYDAVYGRCEVQDQQPDGSYQTACWCYEAGDVGGDTGISPHCLLDGGQVLHTKALWDQATADGWQLTDSKNAADNDGVLLNRLAEFARFHYVPQKIVTHRRHAGATHHKPGGAK